MKTPIALITGGASGLGFELAKLFAADAYSLILVSRNEEHLSKAKTELIEKYQVEVETIAADLINLQNISDIFHSFEERGIAIDVLVNNAGFGLLGDFADLDLEQQLDIINLDISALTKLTHLFLSQASNGAKILNISSMAAFQPGPGMNVYYAAKAYVSSFSEALAEELKSRKISVTTVCPGPIDTNFWQVSGPGRKKVSSTTVLARVSPQFVALKSYQGLKNGSRVVIPGVLNKVLFLVVKLLPNYLVTRGVRLLNSRI